MKSNKYIWMCSLGAENFYVKFEGSVIEELYKYKQIESKDKEGCGILIGEYRKNSLWVKYVTVPQNKDIRARFRYFRKDNNHQWTLNYLHKLNNGLVDYMGEWHSHPESFPQPSIVDLNSWEKLGDYFKDQPKLFLILGNQDVDWLGLMFKGQLYNCSLVTTSYLSS